MPACPVHGPSCQWYVPPSGPSPAKLAILGEGPGSLELRARSPFVGPSGALVDTTLQRVGLRREDVAVYNVIPCGGPEGRPPVPSHTLVAQWRDHVSDWLRSVRPQVILALGTWAYKWCNGPRTVGLTQASGMAYKTTLVGLDVVVVPSVHPAYVLRYGLKTAGSLLRAFRVAAAHVGGAQAPDGGSVAWFPGVRVAETGAALAAMADALEVSEPLVVDLETSGSLHPTSGEPDTAPHRIVAIGLGIPGQVPWVVLPREGTNWRSVVRRVLETHRPYGVIGHNVKFDAAWLINGGLWDEQEGPLFTEDTMLMAYVLDATRAEAGGLSLKALGAEYVGVEPYDQRPVPYRDGASPTAPERAVPISWMLAHGLAAAIPEDILAEYNGRDTYLTGLLWGRLREELASEPGAERLYRRLLLPATEVLRRVEARGVLVNRSVLEGVRDRYGAEVESIKAELCETLVAAGHPREEVEAINWRSTPQVAKVLYEWLGLPVVGRTTLRRPSTGDDALNHLKSSHPVPRMLVRLREAERRRVMAQTLLEAIAPSGRIHPTFLLAGSLTGRLACRTPNLQNVPKGADGARRAFVAPPGYTLIEFDYSINELRWGAQVYRDPTMVAHLQEGKDLHKYTASLAFGKPYQDVTDAERRLGKTANFLLIYGGRPNRLALELRDVLTDEEVATALRAMGQRSVGGTDSYLQLATALYRAFHTAYPTLRETHERIASEANRMRVVRSVFGRVVRVDRLGRPAAGGSGVDHEHRDRQVINSVVQGPASDTTLVALVRLDQELAAVGGHVVNTVHDSILVEVPDHHVAGFVPTALEILRNPPLEEYGIHLVVPLAAEAKVGPSWGSLRVWDPRQEVSPEESQPPTPDETNPPLKAEPISMLEAALAYWVRQWSVIPITSVAAGNVGREAGKAPAIPWAPYQASRASETTLRSWFGSGSRYNVGIVTGSISQLVVVDIDPRHGGDRFLEETALSSPARVRTGGGGVHLYFQLPEGVTIPSRAGIAPGVDIRGEGGLVVAPPSVHYSGQVYVWEGGSIPSGPLPALPEWLVERILTSADPQPEGRGGISELQVRDQGSRMIPPHRVDEVVRLLLPFYQTGVRHDFLRALLGFLAKRHYRMADVEVIMERLMEADGDVEVEDRVRLLRDTYRAAAEGRPVAGVVALETLMDEASIQALLGLFGSLALNGTVEVLSASELAHRPTVVIPWVVRDLLPEGGLFVLSGHPGVGKSTLALQMSLCLAAGRPVFARFAVDRPRRVLYAQADNPPVMIQSLIQQMIRRVPEAGDRLYVANCFQPVRVDTPEGFSTVEQWIELYTPDVVIFDAIRDFHGADENNPTAVADALNALKRLRLRTAGSANTLTIGYIHHFSKSGAMTSDRPEIERHMGSMRFMTPVDLAMSLVWVPGDDRHVRLSYTKVRWAPRPSADIFMRMGVWYEHVATAP